MSGEITIFEYADLIALGAGDGADIRKLFPQNVYKFAGKEACQRSWWNWFPRHEWNNFYSSRSFHFYHCAKCAQYGVVIRRKI